MKATERVIVNTIVLYARLIIVMIIGLYSTRIVFDALGETNYGVYTLVAGTVSLLGILQSAMSGTSMRFMAHSMGSGNKDLISRTFNTTLLLHYIIGLAIVAFIEIGGYFMFKYTLDIPSDKVFDAKIIFHFMALTAYYAIISVPYDAVINSHEHLFVLSLVDIIGGVLKLALAFYIAYTDLNQLILYGFGVFLIQFVLRSIKRVYSRRHYPECKINFRKGFDKKLSREIMAFTGWNLLGSVASMSVMQARSIMLNVFFGVKVNASEGVAKTASAQVNTVSISLTRAINPQLVKSEGSGDRQKMLRITSMSTKFSVFLFALIAIPVIIEMPYLLAFWLKKVPEYAVVFARLSLTGLLLDKFSFEITSAIRAVGKIRQSQIFETLIIVLNLPVTYFLFKAGFPPSTIYVVAIIFAFIAFVFRFYFGKKIAGLNILEFLKQGIFPTILPIFVAFMVGYLIHLFIGVGVLKLVLTFSVCISSMLICIRFFGLSKSEVNKINSLIGSVFKKNKKHG